MTERFTLVSELGRGGMGVVWKARDGETGQIVALKLLREAYAEDPEYVARFERELELARRIDSANVVKVLGYGVRDRTPYLAFEFVDGASLHDALIAHGPYSWPETRDLLRQIAQGLADAHAAGVVHRDVKPSNVLIGSDGIARLTDFGIARGLDLTRFTATSTLLGTPAYLAPEGPKDARSDLYSLGIIGYELLTGAVPFKGTTYQEIIVAHIRETPDLTKLPDEARPIIAWLLAKDPADRPQRASALLPVLWGAAKVPEETGFTSPAPSSRPIERELSDRGAQPASADGAAAQSAGRPMHPNGGLSAGSSDVPLAQSRVKDVRTPLPARRSEPIPDRRRGSPVQRMALLMVAALGVGGLVFLTYVSGGSRTTLPSPSNPPSTAGVAVSTSTQHLITASLPTETSNPFPTILASYAPLRIVPTGSTVATTGAAAAIGLTDGKVLIAGGCQGTTPLKTAELYDPRTGKFSATGSMHVGHCGPGIAQLSDGRVLVAGGDSYAGGRNTPINSAEIWDEATGKWSSTGSLVSVRASPTIVPLPNDRALILDGLGPGYASTTKAEIYDAATGAFAPTGEMTTSRVGATIVLLTDGRVLVAGGTTYDKYVNWLSSAEVYDPATGQFSPTGSLAVAVDGAPGVRISGGRVLIIGGRTGNGATEATEIYDPLTGQFTAAGSLATRRAGGVAAVLDDGRVLVVGGSDGTTSPKFIASTEVFDPNKGEFSPGPAIPTKNWTTAVCPLADGQVLVVADRSAWLYTHD